MLQLRAATNCTWSTADSVKIDPSTNSSFYLSQYPSDSAASTNSQCLDHSLLPPYQTDLMVYFAVFASKCPSGTLVPFSERGRVSARSWWDKSYLWRALYFSVSQVLEGRE